MDVSGQLHASATLPFREIDSQYPLNRWMGGHEGKRKILRSWDWNVFIL